jgi:hypothetical protein
VAPRRRIASPRPPTRDRIGAPSTGAPRLQSCYIYTIRGFCQPPNVVEFELMWSP